MIPNENATGIPVVAYFVKSTEIIIISFIHTSEIDCSLFSQLNTGSPFHLIMDLDSSITYVGNSNHTVKYYACTHAPLADYSFMFACLLCLFN